MPDPELIEDEMEKLIAEAIGFYERVELAKARETLALAHAVECKGGGSHMLNLRAHFNAANRAHQIIRRRDVEPEFRALLIETHKFCPYGTAEKRPQPDSEKEND